MAQFCTNCGAELREGMAFCTECGAKAAAAPEPQAPVWGEPQANTWTQPVQTAPPPPAAPAAPVIPTEEPVGTGTFFWLMLLFALPVIGQLACIILCFVPKRKSLRSFARATLIWFVIALILSLLLGLAAKALISAAAPYFEQLTAELGEMGELGALFEQFGDLEGLMESLPVE